MDRRKRRHIEQYQDMVARLLPERHIAREDGLRVLSRTVTFQVTEDCNLACFIAGTKILMSDFSYKNIEDVMEGDVVMAFPETLNETENFRIEPTKVTHLYSSKKHIRCIKTNNGEVIICTDEHPFLNARREWVKAADLLPDSHLIVFDKYRMKLDTVIVIENQPIECDKVDVYNLETEAHTFVSNNYLVHNCTYCVDGDTQIRMADYTLKSIKEIELGDAVLGFDEYPEKGCKTQVKPAIVEQVFQRTAKVIELLFDNGEVLKITPNHKILVKRDSKDNSFDFVEAGTLSEGDKVYYHPITDHNLDLFDVNMDNNYKIGYLVAMIKGDGSLKHYVRKKDGCDVFKFRIAVKDIEIINRCKKFLSDLDIPFYTKPFKISKKYNLWQEAIFANTRYVYDTLTELINKNFRNNSSLSYYQGFLAGFYDAEGHISNERVIRICNTDKDMIQEGMTALDLLHIPYILEADTKGTINKPIKYNIRITDNIDAISSYRFIKSTNPTVPRKSFEKFLNYSPLKKTSIVAINKFDTEIPVYNIGTSTHTYLANGIAVHNCYQGHKTKKAMSFETAKKAVDMLLSSTEENNQYINPAISPGIIIEFIGGEPLLEIELIDKIVDYFKKEARRLQHPWAEWFCISICSNGVLYFDERVQRFLMKNRNNISFSITIDGNKELHDSCRVFHDGKPSYDLAVAAAVDWMNRGYYMGSKITIAPENIAFLYDAITHMIGLGYTEINANCVYEEGWTPTHATVLYHEMKRISDYLFEHDLEDDIYISLFEDNFFRPMDEGENLNWCWGKGTPILTTEGYKSIEEIEIGDYVYTEDGSIHPVINTLSHFANNVVTISTDGSFDMVCTDDHKLFTSNGKKRVKDITSKDHIRFYKIDKGNISVDKQDAFLMGQTISNNDTNIPEECFNWNKASILAFVEGVKNCKNRECELITNNYSFAQDMLILLRSVGLTPKCRTASNKYVVNYEDCNTNTALTISPVEPQMVYNITVDTNHSYVAGGITSANCGGTCDMLCIDPDGNYSVCIRYLPSSLGDDQPPIYLGNVDRGLVTTDEEKKCVECMKCITRRSQSTDECFNCPIAHGCSWCFKAGTMITTPDGEKPIEELKIGDLVITHSGNVKPVEKIMTRITDKTAIIKIEGLADIYTTLDHPFYVVRKGYAYPSYYPVSQLTTNDEAITLINGEEKRAKILSINKDNVEPYEVYNLTVADDHTFIANGAIVHNCSAYNYQITGTVDQRVTYICIMHKARSLANAYFWNKYYRKHGDEDRFKIHCPDEWALEIISQNELNMLKELENPDTE